MILLFGKQKQVVDLNLFNNSYFGLMDYVDFTHQKIDIHLYEEIIHTCLEKIGEKPHKVYFKITKIFKVDTDLKAIANFYVYVKFKD